MEKMFNKSNGLVVEVYAFFENMTALIYMPGSGKWKRVPCGYLIPLDYSVCGEHMSKSKQNKYKDRLVASGTIWNCTDGKQFNDREEAILHEKEIEKMNENEEKV